jgi:eukaryotic-like serine/threonine-protein kinase
LRGEPVPVAEGVATTGAIGIFSVSATSVLAYRIGASEARSLTWRDRQGKETGVPGQAGSYFGPALSPDAARVAFRDADMTSPGDVWLVDFARGVRTRFTFRQSWGSAPVWSADGSRIFFSAGNNRDTIYEKSANGSGEEKDLLKRPGEVMTPTSLSRDNRFLLYTNAGYAGLWVLPLDGGRKPVLLSGNQFRQGLGSFSPDGRWVAYISNESGRYEVYVRPFNAAGLSLGEGKWQLSRDGATPAAPRWRSDDNEVFFANPNGAPMAVDVSANGAAFQAGVPRRSFDVPGIQGWDVTADGKRFLVVSSPPQSAQTPITVVLNWQADLKH